MRPFQLWDGWSPFNRALPLGSRPSGTARWEVESATIWLQALTSAAVQHCGMRETEHLTYLGNTE